MKSLVLRTANTFISTEYLLKHFQGANVCRAGAYTELTEGQSRQSTGSLAT